MANIGNITYPYNMLVAAFGDYIDLDGQRFECLKLSDTAGTQEGLENILNRLNEREQTIIRMRYMEGCAYSKIAESISLSAARVSQIDKEILKSLLKWKNRKYIVYGYNETKKRFMETMEHLVGKYGSLFTVPISEYVKICRENDVSAFVAANRLETMTIEFIVATHRKRNFSTIKDADYIFNSKYIVSFLFLSLALKPICQGYSKAIVDILKAYSEISDISEDELFRACNTFIPTTLSDDRYKEKLSFPLKFLSYGDSIKIDWLTMSAFQSKGIETVGDLLQYNRNYIVDNHADLEILLNEIGIGPLTSNTLFVLLHRFFLHEDLIRLDNEGLLLLEKLIQAYVKDTQELTSTELQTANGILYQVRLLLPSD